ncbi:hypothetical protein ACLOJK_008293 [Asimina triloba]
MEDRTVFGGQWHVAEHVFRSCYRLQTCAREPPIRQRREARPQKSARGVLLESSFLFGNPCNPLPPFKTAAASKRLENKRLENIMAD